MAKTTYALRYVRSVYVDVNIEAENIAEAREICNKLETKVAYWSFIADAAHEFESEATTDFIDVETAWTDDVSLTESEIKDMLAQ